MYSGTGFVAEKEQASSLVPYLPDLVAAVASAVPSTGNSTIQYFNLTLDDKDMF